MLSVVVAGSVGAAISLGVLLHYAKIYSTFFGKAWSPRLFICWLLPIIDVVVTIILLSSTFFGFGTVTGIGSIIFCVATAIGLSGMTFFVKAIMEPRWRAKYEEIKRKKLGFKPVAVAA